MPPAKRPLTTGESVIIEDIPPKSIAVGSPARVVKQWDEEKKIWKKYEGMINK